MKVLNFGSLNIDYIYQMAHFIRPGETAPCKTLTAGCGGKGLNQSSPLRWPKLAQRSTTRDSTARRRSSCSIKCRQRA